MEVLYVGIGFLMLIAGRPIYSVFVGCIGLLVGSYLADQITFFPSDTNQLLISLLFAVIGVIMTQIYKRWAARLAACIAGGILVINLPHVFGASGYWTSPYLIAAGAIISLVLAFIIFDFAMVVLSSLLAVTLILSYMRPGNLDQGFMFLILLVFGIIIQYFLLQYASPYPD
jgi:hypothetical protein